MQSHTTTNPRKENAMHCEICKNTGVATTGMTSLGLCPTCHPRPTKSERLALIAEIIRGVDHRAQFGDPVRTTKQEIHDTEIVQIFALAAHGVPATCRTCAGVVECPNAHHGGLCESWEHGVR